MASSELKRSAIPLKIKDNILKRQRGKCANFPLSNLYNLEDYDCPLWKQRVPRDDLGLFGNCTPNFDHIEPWAQTHDNDESNIQALCPNCHSYKTPRDNKDTMKHKRGPSEVKEKKRDDKLEGELSSILSTLSSEQVKQLALYYCFDIYNFLTSLIDNDMTSLKLKRKISDAKKYKYLIICDYKNIDNHNIFSERKILSDRPSWCSGCKRMKRLTCLENLFFDVEYEKKISPESEISNDEPEKNESVGCIYTFSEGKNKGKALSLDEDDKPSSPSAKKDSDDGKESKNQKDPKKSNKSGTCVYIFSKGKNIGETCPAQIQPTNEGGDGLHCKACMKKKTGGAKDEAATKKGGKKGGKKGSDDEDDALELEKFDIKKNLLKIKIKNKNIIMEKRGTEHVAVGSLNDGALEHKLSSADKTFLTKKDIEIDLKSSKSTPREEFKISEDIKVKLRKLTVVKLKEICDHYSCPKGPIKDKIIENIFNHVKNNNLTDIDKIISKYNDEKDDEKDKADTLRKELEMLTVPDLKVLCKEFECKMSGLKAEIIDRLIILSLNLK